MDRQMDALKGMTRKKNEQLNKTWINTKQENEATTTTTIWKTAELIKYRRVDFSFQHESFEKNLLRVN